MVTGELPENAYFNISPTALTASCYKNWHLALGSRKALNNSHM